MTGRLKRSNRLIPKRERGIMPNECTWLPVHPRTGLPALGWVGGRPVWPILGGAEDGDAGDSGDNGQGGDDGTATGQTDPDWRTEATKWQALSRKNEERARANAAAARELAALKEKNQSELDKALAAARSETEQQVSAKFTRRLVGLSIKAAAGGKFQDPSDAEYQLRDELEQFVSDEGEVDEKAVREAVERVLKEKPYLGVKVETPPPDFDGGQRSGTGQSGSVDMKNFLQQLQRSKRS